MWFKNPLPLRLEQPLEHSPETIAEALAPDAFRPCTGLAASSFGWERPLGRHGTELVHAAGGAILVCAREDRKILPPSAVREAVEDRVAEIEANERRTVGARERRRLRDEIVHTLLPRALARATRTFAYLDAGGRRLVVDTASPARAEEVSAALARSLGGLAVRPAADPLALVTRMTDWLRRRRPPAGFAFGTECELRDPADRTASVRCRGQELTGDEIAAHLRARKQVHALGLRLEERLGFVLTAEGGLRRLRLESVERSDHGDEPDEVARIDADFAFMAAEVGALLDRLEAALAGEG